jgi:hypothetical protein
MAKHRYVCIKACVWHKPDFLTPRYIEPDGGKTVYLLEEGAPPHIFQRIDLPAPEVQPQPVRQPLELGLAMRNTRAMFLELIGKERAELEKIAAAVELTDTRPYLDNISLVKAILQHAGYIEAPGTATPAAAPGPTVSPGSAVDLVQGSPEAQKELAAEGQPLPAEKVDPEELEMQQLLQERAKEPKPEPAAEPEVFASDKDLEAGSAEIQLLNKTRRELLEIAKEYHVADPEKAPNKPALVAAILKAAGYKLASEEPAGA